MKVDTTPISFYRKEINNNFNEDEIEIIVSKLRNSVCFI